MINSVNKRISFLIASMAGGGAEGVCVNIANGLVERGWQVDLVVLHLNNAVYLDRISEKIHLINLEANNARYAYRSLKKYLKHNNVNKVLVFNYELAVLLVLIRKISFLNFEIIARNINTLSKKQQLKNNIWRKYVVIPMIQKFYSQVDHVINQCNAMEKDLLEALPMLQGKTSVIYNPVNKYIEDASAKIDITKVQKQNYILCVGRLEEQKSFHYAIEAFAQITDQHPNLRLKIVGQGSLEKNLTELANELTIGDKVDFEGFQKDITPYYLHAKATLLTSLYEGFPNVLVESITLGTPIIAFDCQSGPKEIIEEGVNGYLVNYLDVNDLANKIKKNINLAIDKEHIKQSSNKYSLKSIIAQYIYILS